MASLSLGSSAVMHKRRLPAAVVSFSNSNGAFVCKGGGVVNSLEIPYRLHSCTDRAYHPQRCLPIAIIVSGPPEHARDALLTTVGPFAKCYLSTEL